MIKTIFSYIIFLIILSSVNFAQNFSSPYPIIFVHGLNSFEGTWDETINFLGTAFGSKQIFHAVLNAYSGTSLEGPDGILGSNDDDVLFPEIDMDGNPINQLQQGSLFVINFQNFWNKIPSNPVIHTYSNEVPNEDGNDSQGNQSAIYKQGYALSKCIKAVLDTTGASKVILVGHSMGGLAIREYLQRIENGSRKWWVDTTDDLHGHKVAKVVTIGTPHGGSNATDLLNWYIGIDGKSEAMRDLKFTRGINKGIYLLGGNENDIDNSYYSKDVNCNGSNNDSIIGISEVYEDFGGIIIYHLIPSTNLPLPQNIPYTWIVSDVGTGGDGVVDLARQWLYNSDKIPVPLAIADTLMTNRFHIKVPYLLITEAETDDYYSIIRGLDEPHTTDLAYEIKNNDSKKGFITYQKGYNSSTVDIDLYKVILEHGGNLNINISGSDFSGVKQIALLDSTNTDPGLIFQSITNLPANINYLTNAGTYFIRVRGFATNNSFEFPYTLTTSFQELQLITLNEGETLLADETFDIEWTSNNIENVKIELTTDNGINWSSIVNSVSASQGTYSWIVPRNLSNQCRIRISDVSNLEFYKESAENFAIIAPPLKIIEPNGLENWSANSVKKIKWDICNAENVRLELTTDNGINWITITESTTANLFEYNWTVNNLISSTCKIKITDTDNLSDFDLSDNVFTISSQNFWSTDPNVANPICTAYWQQLGQTIVIDGSGGAIIVWADGRSGNWNDIYAQKINSKGAVQWTINGNSVRSKPWLLSETNGITAVSDGNGGAIVAWSEAYSPGGFITYHYIKAQKINAAGNLEWNSDGVPICTASLDRKNVNIVSDGSGGAIITWVDSRNGNWDIFAQRINSSGTTLWQADGIAICTADNDQDSPTIVSDSIGGGIIKWNDNQSDSLSIYAQRINSSGDVQWVSNGVVICSMSVSRSQSAAPPMINDGAGGAIIAWADTRNGINIYAQRINSTGSVQWAGGGVPLGVAHYHANPQMISDGNGGTIITWVSGYIKLKAQKINSNGAVQWGSGGIILFDGSVFSAEIESDYSGGAIISFYKHISYNTPPYSSLAAKRINSDGNVLWNIEFNTSKGPRYPQMIYDGNGGVIVAFLDEEVSSSSNDIYASKINSAGELGGDDIPLPVELISFTGIAKDSYIDLNWSTSTEINNYGFEIEKSVKDKSWQKIGFQAGAGNSNKPNQYHYRDNNLVSGLTKYRLKQIDTNGDFKYLEEIELNAGAVKEFSLFQNYPNPFNPSTKIKYSIPEGGRVVVKVFDILGKEVITLTDEYKDAGYYEVEFDAENLSSGIYFYKIVSGSYSEIKKMVLLR